MNAAFRIDLADAPGNVVDMASIVYCGLGEKLVCYNGGGAGGVPDHDSQRKKNTFSHFTWKIN